MVNINHWNKKNIIKSKNVNILFLTIKKINNDNKLYECRNIDIDIPKTLNFYL